MFVGEVRDLKKNMSSHLIELCKLNRRAARRNWRLLGRVRRYEYHAADAAVHASHTEILGGEVYAGTDR